LTPLARAQASALTTTDPWDEARLSGYTDNSIWIDADIETVWTMTNDLGSWPDLFPEYAYVEILDHRENTVRFRLTMNPDENGNVWSWVSERTLYPEKHRVHSYRVETGLFKYMDIEWTYTREGTGTRMRWVHDFRMRPAASLGDQPMTDRINTNTRREMRVIKRKVEAATQARPAALVSSGVR
jgi:aromatase